MSQNFKDFLQKFSRSQSTSSSSSTSSLAVSNSRSQNEEQILSRTLPDYIMSGLDILFVGVNPGYFSAKEGHYYAGPGNHFWKCLYASGLIPEPISWTHDYRLLEWNIGLTNICARATRGQADLSKEEIREGAEILKQKIVKFKPKIVVFNGKGIYEIFCEKKVKSFGLQEKLESSEVFVMPSSSPRSAAYPRAEDKLVFYTELKKLVHNKC